MKFKGLSWEYYEQFWAKKERKPITKPSPPFPWEVCGQSHGYWHSVRRTRPESEAEAKWATKFGSYWANGTRSWMGGWKYRGWPIALWFPIAAPPPRIGPAAPKRWADQPVEIPPFKYRALFILDGSRPVSGAEEAEARELFRRRNAIRRTDLHKIGSFWFDRTAHTVEDYASSVCWQEMRASRLVKRNGIWTQAQRPFSSEEWATLGCRVSSLPDGLMLSREDRDLCSRILAKSPDKKRGRKPIGEVAMTGAERRKKHYHAHKQFKTLRQPQERHQLGIAAPPPLGPAVPGTLSELEMTKDFLEKLHERLGEVLNRLKDAPPDYLVCGEDFRVLAIAATIQQRLH